MYEINMKRNIDFYLRVNFIIPNITSQTKRKPQIMKTWKFEITMKVADSWIADGFNGSDESRIEQIAEAMHAMLPYAYEHEVEVTIKVTKSPDPKVIEGLQNGELEIKS
jgi:methyl coenzyme M reductase subunit D